MSFGGQEYKNPNDDIMVNNSPRETVQSISWSPNNRFLAAGGWDSKVSLYQVNSNNGQTKPVAQTKHDAPVLDTSFHDDGSGLFSSSCDKTVKFWKFQGNQSSVVAKHEKPIKGCYWNKQLRMLITGGWDKRLCYWDLRQKKLACSVNLPERLYCMDVLHPLVVCATANRRIVMYHLSKPDKVFREAESKLNFQSRVIAAFGDRKSGQPDGYALGSIEGRVSIGYVDPRKAQQNDFAFKCHRLQGNDKSENQVYAINAISFHRRYWTFATAGSDGNYFFWDKDSKHMLKQKKRCPNSISAASFSSDCNMYAYALGYDWSKGMEGYDRNRPNAIYLHRCRDNEIQPKRS